MSARAMAWALLFGLAGGASACQASVPPGAVAPAPDPFPIVPMQILIVRGRAEAMVLTLEKDGVIRDGTGAVGKLRAGRVLAPNGEERVAVAIDGGVTFAGKRTPLRFTSQDDVASNNGKRISIDEHGAVVLTPPMKRNRQFSFRVEGFAPAARKTALLMFLLVVLQNERADED